MSIIVGTIALGFIASLYRYKLLNKADRVIFYLLLLTTIDESIAYYSAWKFKTNIAVYGFYSPIQLLIIALYFNYSIEQFRKKNIGVFIGVIGCLFGYIDYFFIQNPNEMNNIFLLTEGIIVVGMCLYSFYSMLLSDDDLQLITYEHFWFTTILLFFWTSTFLVWGLYAFMTDNLGMSDSLLTMTLMVINVVTYLAFATVFFFYKKMQRVYAQ